ncbi:heterokaryon incompatibility protein-domain-containing protein [Scleroderma yunnanense]
MQELVQMRLINVKVFLEREESMKKRKRADRQTKVLEFRNDEAIDYAILSHRWFEQEVDCDEMIGLAKMGAKERDEIRRRLGYKKILDSCERAKKDGLEWLWVDACCIDKRSSAELSEAINSMFRWYENSRVCYAYLHDVIDSSLPMEDDKRTYPYSNGWPEWFSRGWTLQEMIAPRNVEFFNKDWQPIGNKWTLAPILADITRVPEHILRDGLTSNRPCVAQIMSWAANRTTTRIEDRAYSLLGLLDVNMPMLYGEGKKAFQRLQLEIIRMSNDQSIFAWRGSNRTGSILADDSSCFRDCSTMELMDLDEFTQSLKGDIPEEELRLIEEDRFGVFPITNRGIQIWLLLRPLDGSRSVFEALLPCRVGPLDPPVTITLNLWKSNYYRYSRSLGNAFPTEQTLQFSQLYLSYRDTLHHDAAFEIDDSAITENGLAYCGAYPWEPRGNTVTVAGTNSLCVRVYADTQADCRFAVGFGHCFGQDWIHLVYEEHSSTTVRSWKDYAEEEYRKMRVSGPEHAQSMAMARSQGECYGCVWIMQTHLPGSCWTVRTSCVVWESSRNCGVRIDAFQDPGFGTVSNKWRCFDVDRTNDPNRDMRSLMIPSTRGRLRLLVDGVIMEFSPAPNGVKLGDYGHFIDPKDFCCEGNIFDDLKFLTPEPDITPRQHKIDKVYGSNAGNDYVTARWRSSLSKVHLYKPLGLSLPSNPHFNLLLTSLSTRLTNRYLVTKVIQCAPVPPGERSRRSSHPTGSKDRLLDPTAPLCTIEKPFVWYRDEDAAFASVEWPSDSLWSPLEIEDD